MRDPPVFIPAPVDRYRQILLPALRLCQVILTSSTAQHLQAAGQVRRVHSVEESIVWKSPSAESSFSLVETQGLDHICDFTLAVLFVANLGIKSQPLVLCCELHWPILYFYLNETL